MIASKKIDTIKVDIRKQDLEKGSVILNSMVPLESHPYRLTERLKHWAAVAPNRIFIGRKNVNGTWDTLSYAETFVKVRSIAQALLKTKASSSQPLAILSENSIEHALMALAALHAGGNHNAVKPVLLRAASFVCKNVHHLNSFASSLGQSQ